MPPRGGVLPRIIAGLAIVAAISLLCLAIDAAPAVGQVSGEPAIDDTPRPPWKPGESCVSSSCHANLRSGKLANGNLHGPVALRACGPCHETVDNHHEFRPTFEGAELCRQCHESFFSFEKTIGDKGAIHGPVAAGQCTSCHDPHGGKTNVFTLRKKVDDGLCFDCHEREDLIGDGKPHGPLQLGSDCTICHDPHASKHPKLQRKSGVELCSTCHDEIKQLNVPGMQWHQPAEENCANCHDPHSSSFPKHLHGPLPGLCLSCHAEQAEELGGTRIHAALKVPERCSECHTKPPSDPNAEECPLVGPAGEPGNCLSCHNPHGSQHGKLLQKPLMETCLECHDQPIVMEGRPTIQSVKDQIEGKAHVHGPLRQGNCVACHKPHASDHWRLLKQEFPESFYADFEKERYGLCFQCHDDALVTERTTRLSTNFRHGDKNLHAVHVNREKKGRSCRACHEIHASDLPFQLRKTTPFGKWQMPIDWTPDEDGGKCAPGCHEPAYYNRSEGKEQP